MEVTRRQSFGNVSVQCADISSSSDRTSAPEYRVYSSPTWRLRPRRPIHNNYPACFVITVPEVLHSVAPDPVQPLQPETSPLSSSEAVSGKPLGSTRNAVLAVIAIFLCSVFALVYVYMSFPNLEENERQHIRVPLDIEQAKQLGIVLNRYKDRYYLEVISGVFITYVFLQTFAIPGSLFLSILSGFLFPFLVALILVCVCSALGASLCYLLSLLLGRRLVYKYFPEKAESWALIVEKHRDNLLSYMLFLRMTPFLPNWFINLTAPVIGVPLVPFALGTFLGVAPPSFVAIQAGQTLHKMTSSSEAFSWWSFTFLAIFGTLFLIPAIMKDKLKQKFE